MFCLFLSKDFLAISSDWEKKRNCCLVRNTSVVIFAFFPLELDPKIDLTG